MANPMHLSLLKKGPETWHKWRTMPGNFDMPDLAAADLSGMDLHAATLGYVNLAGADLSGADLRRAFLTNADLREACVSGADLSHARLAEADLSGADLSGADLSGADLSEVELEETIFVNTNLTGAIGLESCVRRGPSSLGIDSLLKSGGSIPESFLRGVGLPDQFIAYARSLIGQSIESYSCFISYSTKDQEFADRLHADLQSNAVRCWFAPHDIEGGKKVHEQIDEAIRVYDRLLLILSEYSTKSDWVETEISKARKRELREGRRMLFPVRLIEFAALRDWECFDADTGKDSAREIREYFIPDFSHWKDPTNIKSPSTDCCAILDRRVGRHQNQLENSDSRLTSGFR